MRIDIVRGGLVALVALLVGGCPSKDDGLAPVASTPEEALTLANPRQTLKMLGLTHGPDEKLAGATEADRVLFAVASLDLDRWADAEVVVARVKDAAVRGILQCYLAGKRMDIDAERRCRDAITAAKTQTGVAPFLVDSAELGLAAAIERNNRLEAAAEVYEGLAKARPNVRNRKALHGFYDRVGWVKEDVVALEAWVQDAPNDPTVKATLRAALERKVKGSAASHRPRA